MKKISNLFRAAGTEVVECLKEFSNLPLIKQFKEGLMTAGCQLFPENSICDQPKIPGDLSSTSKPAQLAK